MLLQQVTCFDTGSSNGGRSHMVKLALTQVTHKSECSCSIYVDMYVGNNKGVHLQLWSDPRMCVHMYVCSSHTLLTYSVSHISLNF